MNLPIDTTTDGCAFAVKPNATSRTYAKNIGNGGGHYPFTSVCVVYQLGWLDCEDDNEPLPQGMLEQLSRHGVERGACDGGGDSMGDLKGT